jgi:hypothetical protein
MLHHKVERTQNCDGVFTWVASVGNGSLMTAEKDQLQQWDGLPRNRQLGSGWNQKIGGMLTVHALLTERIKGPCRGSDATRTSLLALTFAPSCTSRSATK